MKHVELQTQQVKNNEEDCKKVGKTQVVNQIAGVFSSYHVARFRGSFHRTMRRTVNICIEIYKIHIECRESMYAYIEPGTLNL